MIYPPIITAPVFAGLLTLMAAHPANALPMQMAAMNVPPVIVFTCPEDTAAQPCLPYSRIPAGEKIIHVAADTAQECGAQQVLKGGESALYNPFTGICHVFVPSPARMPKALIH